MLNKLSLLLVVCALGLSACQTTQSPNFNISGTDAQIAKLLYDRCMSSAYGEAAKSKISGEELAQNCKCTTPVFLKFLKPELKEAMLNKTSYRGRGSAFTDKDAFEAEIRRKCPSTARWIEEK
jgi:hypothetical protein